MYIGGGKLRWTNKILGEGRQQPGIELKLVERLIRRAVATSKCSVFFAVSQSWHWCKSNKGEAQVPHSEKTDTVNSGTSLITKQLHLATAICLKAVVELFVLLSA
jgi:hypothetical protein